MSNTRRPTQLPLFDDLPATPPEITVGPWRPVPGDSWTAHASAVDVEREGPDVLRRNLAFLRSMELHGGQMMAEDVRRFRQGHESLVYGLVRWRSSAHDGNGDDAEGPPACAVPVLRTLKELGELRLRILEGLSPQPLCAPDPPSRRAPVPVPGCPALFRLVAQPHDLPGTFRRSSSTAFDLPMLPHDGVFAIHRAVCPRGRARGTTFHGAGIRTHGSPHNMEDPVDKAIQEALNEQINAELHSAYTYLAMSAHFAEQNLDGFATWMRLQAQEEVGHAMKLYDYVIERGGHVGLKAIAEPARKLGTPLKIFETALAHEKKITGMIHALYELARKNKDYATEKRLDWFVTEQVEEEDNAGRAVEQLRRAGDNLSALLMLDQRFGARSTGE